MRFSVRSGLVLVLAGSALLGSLSPAGGFAGFGDVPEESFYTEAVQWMVDNGITTGTSPGCFSPNDAVTRGQAAAFMWRMEGRPAASPHPFNDVNASWQQGPVSWMYEQGITTGTSPVTYSPNETLTRGQLAALLWRLEGEPGAPSHPFNDVVASWQQGPVSWMASASPAITTGTSPSTFSPNDPVTRGQLATFFWRYKGKPAVIVDLTHPVDAGCEGQIEVPTGFYNGIGVGDCFDFPTDSDPSANRKSCSSAHEGEMFVKDYVPSSFLNPAMPYPTDAEWSEIAADACHTPFASYTGLTISEAHSRELFSGRYLFTLEEDWWRIDLRNISCAITQYYDGGTIYGSAYSTAWNNAIFIDIDEVELVLENQTGTYAGIGVGDCFDFPTDSDPSANRKSCSSAHEGEMFVKDYVPSSFLNPAMPYPTDAEWNEIAWDVCDARFASYTGLTIFDALDEELFTYTVLVTLEQDWWRTDWRNFSCAITQYYDGGTIYGSAYSSAWNEWIFISAYEVVLRLS